MLNNEEADVVSLFQTWATSDPDAIAIEDCTLSVTNPQKLTYRQLDECSNAFAHELRENGVRPGDAIPLLSRRTPEVVIAILAILKCEACYVPMDAETWSSDRIQMTLQQIQPRLIVSTNSVESDFHFGLRSWRVLNTSSWRVIQAAISVSAVQQQGDSAQASRLDRLAYIIFTSGTTGRPKGVMVSMRSISAYCRQCDPDRPFNLSYNPNSRVLCVVSIAFDACVGIIFSTITSGGTLVLADPSTFTATAKRCTVLPMTPSILSTLDPCDGFDSIKAIYLGGESPPPALIQAWSKPGRRIFNAYGPTEATCATLLSELTPGGPITVGWPIWYSKVILVDSNGKKTEDEGEIYIGGIGLAVGYFGNEEATNKAFITHDGERFYRTGDLGRLTPEGFIFRGRMDSMVKNRGFLINLEAEVEPAILSFPGVTGAVAMKVGDSLLAFVTPKVEVNLLRRYLNDHVSTFLVPDTIYGLHEYPQTPNGKIDRERLKSFYQEEDSKLDAIYAQSLPSDRNVSPLEATKRSFCLVLRLPETSVAAETSFLQNGGHSLSAVRMVSTLRKLGYATSVSEILTKDTVDAVSQSLMSVVDVSSPSTLNADNAPMTDLQLRMVRATMQSPALHYIKIGMTFDHLDRRDISNTLRHAWEAIYRAHEIFRTTWDLEVGDGVQVIHDEIPLNWDEQVVSEDHWDAACTTAIDINQWEESSSRGMRPLSCFRLITLPAIRTRLIWTVHHSLIDGWSAAKLLGDLKTFLACGKVPVAPVQFKEAACMMHRLAQETYNQALQYWQAKCQHFLPVKRILLTPPFTAGNYRAASKIPTQAVVLDSLGLPVSFLDIAAKCFGVTSSTLIYAAWALLLSCYCDSDKVALGAVVAGRTMPLDGIEHVMGPLINTLPLCVDTDQDSVGEFVGTVFQSLRELLGMQYSSHSMIYEATEVTGSDLFETVLAIQYDFPSFGPAIEGEMAPRDLDFRESTELPLTVLVNQSDGILETRLLYSCQSYDQGQATQILKHFHRLVHAIIRADSQTSLDEVNARIFDGVDDPGALLAENPQDMDTFGCARTVQMAIQQSVAQFRNLCAVEEGRRSLSYQQLGCFMNVVSSQINKVTRPGDVVCIISDGSIEWLVAILAVIQSGCTYCPIDAKLPRARQQYMIDSTSAEVVLFPRATMRYDYPSSENIKAWDVESLITQNVAQRNHDYRDVGEDDIAVIIFTSGSKGVPKAVQLQHKGIMSLLCSPEGRLYSMPGWRIAQTLSLGFDCCVLEVLSAICFGGALVLKDVNDPLAHLSKVDAIVATPSLLATLEPEEYENLRVVFLLGEALHQNLVDRWRPGRLLQNCYGPAECTLFVTFKRFCSNGERVSIGKPVPRVRCYILDKKQRPVPKGVKGEIYISGIQVTPGYRNNRVQTAMAFLPDPFARSSVMFKTGDMGRLLANGEIEYIGREDDLFKVRGFRVDLGDIEASILAIAPEVQNVAVVIPSSSDILIAFVTPLSVDIPLLEEKLKVSLPQYMVPARIMCLSDLPLSPNDKVDRKKLAEMKITSPRTIVSLASQTEQLIASIWREVLGDSPISQQISPSDEFFSIGGHSLLQIRVAQRLSRVLNIPFPLKLVIKHPTLQSLSRAIDDALLAQGQLKPSQSFLSSQPMLREGELPLSFVEEELLVNYMLSDASPAMNIVFATEFNKFISTPILNQAFKECVHDREVFLSRYEKCQGRFLRRIVPIPASIRKFTPSKLSFDDFLDAVRNYRLDLQREQPVQAWIYQHSACKVTLVFLMSHLVGDAVTMNGFIKDISVRYNALARRDLDDPAFYLTDTRGKLTYIDWASWSKSKNSFSDDLSLFWKEYLHNPPFHTCLNQHHKPRSYQGDTQSWTIPSTLSGPLLELCSAMSITPHQFMLAAVAMATQTLRQSQDIILMAPYSLRTEPGTEDLAGCLLDRVPIRVRWEEAATLQGLLHSVHQSSQAAVAHAIPYSALCKLLNFKPSLTESLAEIMVTFHPANESFGNPDLGGSYFGRPFFLRPHGAKFPLLFEFFHDNDNQLSVALEHDEGIISDAENGYLMSAFRLVLELMIENRTVNEIVSAVRTGVHQSEDGVYSPLGHPNQSFSSLMTGSPYVVDIRDAFARCLNVDVSDVLSDSSFFDLGGSSLDCVRLVWLLEEKGIHVTVRQVLLWPTPAQLDQVVHN